MALKEKSYIKTNEILNVDDYIRSANHKYIAVMQGDGNLSVYRGDTLNARYNAYMWGIGKTEAPCFAVLQSDGSLCVYKGTGPADNHGLIWSSQRTGTGEDFFAVLQDDGNLCIYAGLDPESQGQLVWDSHRFDSGAHTDTSSVNPALTNAIRMAVIAGTKQIPAAGALVSGLVGILWPESGKDSWIQIKEQIEALINQKLADFKYQDVKERLAGLKSVIAGYIQALADTSNSKASYITEKYNVAIGLFDASSPHFMSKDYEMLLLPMLVQMANLHLALLRDGTIYGRDWGWNEKIQKTQEKNLQDAIKLYGDWVSRWYKKGYDSFPVPQPTDANKVQWATRNRYVRSMTLQILDIAFYWPYFDPAKGPAPKLTREIYSDPMGSAKASENPINVDGSVKPRLTELAIWAGGRIDAVQQGFGGGELGPRVGNDKGGTCSDVKIDANNPVAEVVGFAGEVLEGIALVCKDGSRTHFCGQPHGDFFVCFIEGHVLSQLYISGENRFYGTAEAVVCGFRLADSYDDA